MAAPLKSGLDYFPLWVNFFENDKIKILRARYGGDKAAMVVIRLLTKIYAKGYYYKCTDDKIFLLSLDMGSDFTPEYIKSIILGAVERDFFNKELYQNHEVLTSTYVQENYEEATQKRKIDKSMERPFWVLPSKKIPRKVVNSNTNGVNDGINSEKGDINPQSRVDKSKVKKKKVFIAPTIEDATQYLEVEKNKTPEDALYFAERFWLHYDSKGWKVGRIPMVNWKSSLTASTHWADTRPKQDKQTNHPTSIKL